ncbi:MAG: TIGR04255 family protein [Mariprofundaceae bacterium]|nr:TIGR04255 family protein [Mariprofundaceae bacterium]
MSSTFTIDLQESFSKLKSAPIVEAILEIRTIAQADWNEDNITKLLKTALPDYPHHQSLKSLEHLFKVEQGQPLEQQVSDLGWKGLRCESEDKKCIVQFYKDSFIFSQLQPYDCGDTFFNEALKLWEIHKRIAQPTEIQRIGLRYVNRITVPQAGFNLEDYLTNPPEPPQDLEIPFTSFMHHETFNVPNYPYGINFVKAIQEEQTIGLILDIDVFMNQPVATDTMTLEKYLPEMRWLKNKVFANSITKKALEV